MGRNLALLCVVLGMMSLPVASYGAEPAPGSVVLPTDEASLSKLNDTHLRLVRKAVRECSVQPVPVNGSGTCMIPAVERMVSQSNDPMLKAFNTKLPSSLRYNENRTILDVERVMPHAKK